MKLSVVIPTHDRVAKLSLTLDGLALQSVSSGWEVLVVANRCTDGTTSFVKSRRDEFPVELRVIEEPSAGAAAARNAGARAAEGSDVLFLDDDMLVLPHCVERLFEDRDAHPGAWIVGQVLPLAEHAATQFGQFRAAFMPPAPAGAPITEVRWFASGIALVPRRSLLGMGGYDEGFHGAALEDADLVIRAVRSGVTVLFDPALISYHNDWAGTSIRDFARRQRLHCATAPMLDRRFGADDHPWAELITANRPPRRGVDSPAAAAKKLAKHIIGMELPHAAVLSLASALERVKAPRSVLWPVYRAAVAGAMYAGYQDGLRDL